MAAVTWQPGVATSRAPFSSVRYSSGSPNTASASSSGWSCSKPYHLGYSDGVLQPVGGREVDDAADLADELRRQRHARLVRQAEEDDVEPLRASHGSNSSNTRSG